MLLLVDRSAPLPHFHFRSVPLVSTNGPIANATNGRFGWFLIFFQKQAACAWRRQPLFSTGLVALSLGSRPWLALGQMAVPSPWPAASNNYRYYEQKVSDPGKKWPYGLSGSQNYYHNTERSLMSAFRFTKYEGQTPRIREVTCI